MSGGEAPLRVGLIGFGLAGASFHAPLIAAVPGLALAAVATSRAAEVARRWPGMRVVPDAAALLADPTLALIVVATPDRLHAEHARAALSAGRHVVVDKPFVVDLADGAALIALARDRGIMLSVFHNRRWDGDFLTVRDVLARGVLGDVALAELRWDRFRPAIKPGWREAGGAGLLYDLGPHLVDQALRLFGPPDALHADIAAQRAGAAADDYFELVLQYGARRVIVGSASVVAAPRPRFALHGPRGSFVKHGLDPQEAVLRAGGTPGDAGYGEDAPAAYAMLTLAEGTGERVATRRGDWTLYYRGIAEAIRGTGPVPVPAEEALAVMHLIDAARTSAREERRIALRA